MLVRWVRVPLRVCTLSCLSNLFLRYFSVNITGQMAKDVNRMPASTELSPDLPNVRAIVRRYRAALERDHVACCDGY